MNRTSIIVLAPVLVAGTMAFSCFSPKISEGVICGEDDACPPGMLCDPLDGRCRFELLGVSKDLRLIPESVDFGSVVQGNKSFPWVFTVLNLGMVSSKPLEVRIENDQFVITNDGCNGAVLEREGSCSFAGLFEPSAAGEQTSTFTVTDTDNGAASIVTGTGLAPGDLMIQPTNHFFGEELIGNGTEAAAQTFMVENTGDTATGALDVSLEPQGTFTMTNDCQGPLAPASSCAIEVRFNPPLAGSAVSSLLVTGDPGGSTSSSLGGTGIATLIVEHSGTSSGLVVSTPPGINCGSKCENEFDVGFVALTALPSVSATFQRWTGKSDCTTEPTCEFTMNTKEQSVTAQWCVPGAFLRCQSQNAVSCGINYGENVEICQAAGCNIAAGRCNQCVPGTPYCMNDTVISCPNGIPGTENTCPATHTCQSGACVPKVDNGDAGMPDAGIAMPDANVAT